MYNQEREEVKHRDTCLTGGGGGFCNHFGCRCDKEVAETSHSKEKGTESRAKKKGVSVRTITATQHAPHTTCGAFPYPNTET